MTLTVGQPLRLVSITTSNYRLWILTEPSAMPACGLPPHAVNVFSLLAQFFDTPLQAEEPAFCMCSNYFGTCVLVYSSSGEKDHTLTSFAMKNASMRSQSAYAGSV